MKIRNLLLGSFALAGLSTSGAYAADLGVLTSLDVCDALGLSGLTISSDTNCLQITGEVKYKFVWGDYADSGLVDVWTGAGVLDFIAGDGNQNWQSRFDAWVKFVATADSDFGPAKAVLKLKQVQNRVTVGNTEVSGIGGSDTGGVIMDEAYVSIGDSTVIMAGKKGSIMNKGNDEPLNFLGLFNSEKVDLGVSWGGFDSDLVNTDGLSDGGHVIQVVSDLGNGLSLGAGLEKLDHSNAFGLAGTAVGVLAYAGEGISAHITGAAAGVLDGEIEAWGVHAGFSGSFDNLKVVLAGAYGTIDADGFRPGLLPTDPLIPVTVDGQHWNVLGSVSATFDMFTLAVSAEAVNDTFLTGGETDVGAGASISAAVTDTVQVNLGGRWYNHNDGTFGGDDDRVGDSWQVAAQVIAAVTESITLTGEAGYVQNPENDLFYGSGKVAWAPGGGYTSSLKGTLTSEEGYKIESEFKKTFE